MEARAVSVVENDIGIEKRLANSGQETIHAAMRMAVKCQEDYESAGKFLVEIKTRAKAIKDYWLQPKNAAKAAHQAICDKEKAMLAPLSSAEGIIKQNMVDYQAAVERACRDAEKQDKERQRAEVERLLQEAVEADKSGDEQGAYINMAMAEMVDDMPAAAAVQTPSAVGTSIRKTWKARVTDEAAVPAYANGMMIRRIDGAALNNIAKMTKGTAVIPGVEFYMDSAISVRA